MLMVGAHSWLRRRWKSSQRVNPKCPAVLSKWCSDTYASCRPCRSNRDGLVHVVSRCRPARSRRIWIMSGEPPGPRASSQHVQSAIGESAAYTYRGWCGGGAFRRVSPCPSKSAIAIAVPDHRPYHDHPGASCACRRDWREFVNMNSGLSVDRFVATYPLPADTWRNTKLAGRSRGPGERVQLGTYMAAVLSCLGKPGRLRQLALRSALRTATGVPWWLLVSVE
jgi:hypothetical protein